MCNLNKNTTTHKAVRQLFQPARDLTNGTEINGDCHADRPAPIVRNADGERILAFATWGMSSPQFVTKGKQYTGTMTNPWKAIKNRFGAIETENTSVPDYRIHETERRTQVPKRHPNGISDGTIHAELGLFVPARVGRFIKSQGTGVFRLPLKTLL